MEADEVAISLYLKSYPGQFVSAAEICRRAGTKRRFRKQPDWALPILKRMVDAGLLESDSTGHYRLAPTQERERKKRRWVSPQISRILKQSGKTFDIVSPDEDTGSPDQHYRD
ncbi:MAG TPA: hypothetical protein VJA21_15780 [Verrucomicrobiae bacterium]